MTNNTMKVDWDQPLEAVHEDGRVVPVEVRSGPYGHRLGFYDVEPELEGDDGETHFSFNNDGTHRYAKWTIRNKPAAAVAPEHAPEAPQTPAEASLGVLTGVERVERLEALTARLAAIELRSFHGDDLVGLVHEARGLAPIDPVEALADKLYEEWLNNSEEGTRAAIVTAIKAGREMGK